jgi:hypothetical protein
MADALFQAADEFEPERVGDTHLASRVVHKLRYLAAMARSGDWPKKEET